MIYFDDILDEARYQNYKENVVPNIAAASAKYIVRGGQTNEGREMRDTSLHLKNDPLRSS